MYRITIDEKLFCTNTSEEFAVLSPVVQLEANMAGTFTFTVLPNHPMYDEITTKKSVVKVEQNGIILFDGLVTEQKVDFYLQKTVSCEGCLTYFNDTIQRPARYQGITLLQLFQNLLTRHNVQSNEDRQFLVGTVTVTDPNDYVYCYTNFDTTMKSINEDLIDDYGGYLHVSYDEDGNRKLDYFAESPRQNTQVIRIGNNLIDVLKSEDATTASTVLIPLGAVLKETDENGNEVNVQEVEGLDTRLDIKSVNGNIDFLESQEGIELYGRITEVIIWDDVTDAQKLKNKGENYLNSLQRKHLSIEVSAFDLSLSDADAMDFRLLDSVRVLSEPHDIDDYFMITKITYDLNNPQNNTLKLSMEV